MRPIAIFDIDGTIFRSSLTIELLKHLVRRRVFSPAVMKQVLISEKRWINRQGKYEDFVYDMVEAYRRAIVGKKRRDIVAASREVIEEQKSRTYRYTLKLLEQIRGKYLTVAISGSPLEAVTEYNRYLKFDKIYGWEFGLDEHGCYTKAVLHAPSQYKRELIVRYVENHGLSFKGSIGVGDTESDAGFLDLVDRPIAFNPNLALARHAKKFDWIVVTERKDLIIEFKPTKVKMLTL